MGFYEHITRKLSSAVSDKAEQNRLVLRWKRSFEEVEKALNRGRKGRG